MTIIQFNRGISGASKRALPETSEEQNQALLLLAPRDRQGLIPPSRQPDLWSYLGGIARKNGFKAIAVGGTDNHIHVLVSLPATMPLAKAMQLLKECGSSKWMNDSGANAFAWQAGYGAFSVRISQQADTISYIRSQAIITNVDLKKSSWRFSRSTGSNMTRPTFGVDFSHPSRTSPFLRPGPSAEAPGYSQSPLRGWGDSAG